MSEVRAGNRPKLGRFWSAVLYTFPFFLGSLAMEVKGRGWEGWVYFAMGALFGLAVVRGIQAAIGPSPSIDPGSMSDWIFLREIRQRAKGEAGPGASANQSSSTKAHD